ncbi:alpha/beta hydrolase-fold protein [Actinoplanes sp. NPDC089786]|uniref:alpha/beta hydrolase n=1 Tax=Actinoplanes sp. NPDC089786 TaxID=3155185 RepID=UPI00341F71F1
MRRISRRTLLTAGSVAVTAAAAGLYLRENRGPAQVMPTAPAGDERLTQEHSEARGRTVDFYTAVPDGYGDGRGLPVCLILHGGSKRPADFAGLGLGRFLTEAVQRGAAPFVLAGATGDQLAWKPHGDDDPQRMAHEEIPAWCAARDFDTTRLAAWGWSMGGSGALLLAATFPSFVRAVAAFSPAVAPGDAVFRAAPNLRPTPIGLWCGRDDNLYDNVRALPVRRAAGSYGDGNHNFAYWSTAIPAAFDFIAATLSSA